MNARSSSSSYLISSNLPRLFKPAIATMMASISPDSMRLSRVSTFPRSGTIVRPGLIRSASNLRRGDEDPSLAPFGNDLRCAPLGETNASRGFSRGGVATMRNSGASTAGRSFIE
jgi:hypothetical protein